MATNIICTALPIILAPMMALLMGQITKLMKSKENDSNGIKILLKSNMRELHAEYIAKGYVTSDELAEFKDMYDAYHNLKGNGRGTIWMEDIDKLERKE